MHVSISRNLTDFSVEGLLIIAELHFLGTSFFDLVLNRQIPFLPAVLQLP